MTTLLDGRVAIVTGAGRGIGRDHAPSLARHGANVADFQAAKAMIDEAVGTFGDLHILVNNAGILRDRVLANMTEEEWDAVIHVHLKGHFVPTRWAAAYWREQT